jgi:hypothetical protein
MYCSGCGQALMPGQTFCPQCGRPMAAPVPPVPDFQFQIQSFAGKVRALSIVWYIYAGLTFVFGFIGMAFARAALAGRFGHWMNGPMPMEWMGPAILHLAWIFIVIRAGLALAAGYGLMEHAPWGRVVAIVAAFFSILKFPLGTALAIWTLVMLLGYRNNALYDQLPPQNSF